MSCNVVSPYNIVSIDPQNSYIIEVSTPGPQGPQGPSGSMPNTGSFATTGSNVFKGNQVISGSVTVSGSVLIISPNTFTNVGPAVFSGSVNIFSGSLTLTSGSFIAGGNSSFTGSLFGTASFANNATSAVTASYALNFNPDATSSYALKALNADTSSFQSNIQYLKGYIPLFNTTSSLSSSALHQSNSYSIIINREFGTGLNPEALFVFQPNTSSINIATFESNVNNYSQINVRNESAGNNASSDIVATANNGDEFYYFIDMGINGSNYASGGYLGGPNDAYVYSLGKNFHIGNAASDGSHLAFFVGGDNVDTYTKLILRGNNEHALTGSLKILNDLWVVGTITGSISGSGVGHFSGSFAGNGSQLINIPASSIVGLNIINNAAPGRVVVSDGSSNAATASAQLLVTESVVRFATQSFNPTGSVAAGSIWFTSSSFYVSLD